MPPSDASYRENRKIKDTKRISSVTLILSPVPTNWSKTYLTRAQRTYTLPINLIGKL